jgi:hypothetical protein
MLVSSSSKEQNCTDFFPLGAFPLSLPLHSALYCFRCFVPPITFPRSSPPIAFPNIWSFSEAWEKSSACKFVLCCDISLKQNKILIETNIHHHHYCHCSQSPSPARTVRRSIPLPCPSVCCNVSCPPV